MCTFQNITRSVLKLFKFNFKFMHLDFCALVKYIKNDEDLQWIFWSIWWPWIWFCHFQNKSKFSKHFLTNGKCFEITELSINFYFVVLVGSSKIFCRYAAIHHLTCIILLIALKDSWGHLMTNLLFWTVFEDKIVPTTLIITSPASRNK